MVTSSFLTFVVGLSLLTKYDLEIIVMFTMVEQNSRCFIGFGAYDIEGMKLVYSPMYLTIFSVMTVCPVVLF